MLRRALCCLLCCIASSSLAGCASAPRAALPAGPPAAPLIPRQWLFGNPEKQAGRISPDKQWLAYLAPVGGVLNLHLASRLAPQDARVLTFERGRAPEAFYFAHDGRHLIYTRDEGGDENFRLFAVDLRTGRPGR